MLLFEFHQPANAAADDHPAAKRIFLGKVEAAVFHGGNGGDLTELGKSIQPPRRLGVDHRFRIEVFDFAAEVHFEIGRVE